MTGSELLKHYMPAYCALQRGRLVKVLLSIAAQKEVMPMKHHSPQGLCPKLMKRWEQGGIIRMVRARHYFLWPQITERGLKLLRCKDQAHAAEVLAHERSLDIYFRKHFHTWLALVHVAAAKGELSLRDVRMLALQKVDSLNLITLKTWEKEGWVTVRREPGLRTGQRHYMRITKKGLEVLKLDPEPDAKNHQPGAKN